MRSSSDLCNKAAWDLEKRYDPESCRGANKIKVDQNVLFKRQADALRLFGYTKGNYQRGTWMLPDGSGDFVWFPRLYKQGNWDNELSASGTEIIERAITAKAEANPSDTPSHYMEKSNRIVFARAKDVLGHVLYRYVGTFKLNARKSKYGITHFDIQNSEQEICFAPKGSYIPLNVKSQSITSPTHPLTLLPPSP